MVHGMPGLERFAHGLPFNDIVEVWAALCEEKGWDLADWRSFVRFLRFLKEEGVRINQLSVCPKVEGANAELANRAARFFGTSLITFVVKTDSKTIEKIRSFRP